MAEAEPDAAAPAPGSETPAQIGLNPALVGKVVVALDGQDSNAVQPLIQDLHYSDLADLFEALSSEQRRVLVEVLRRRFPAEIIPELDESVRDDVAGQLGTQDLASAIAKLDSDDALYLIEGLEEGKRRQVLHAIPAALRRPLEEGLAYPEDSAGRLMQRDVVAVPQYWNVGQCIDDIRESDELPDDFYDIFVVDPKHRPVGWVPLDKFVRSKRPTRIGEIMETDLRPIPADMDQEQVAFLFKQHDLTSAPVVDKAGRLIGTITVDDVVDVIEEEAEEDLMRLAGVPEADIHASPMSAVSGRARWLAITLTKTIISAIVISHFEATIAQMVTLAVLMPIVGAMAGDAGMQAVTVVVRAIATKEITSTNLMRVVAKEVAVGSIHGVLFAVVMGLGVSLWFHDWKLGLVLAAAMLFNLAWAGFAGTAIPLALSKIGRDPAIASGPLLTTTTDVLGFFSFLGLATWFLL
jgi:magnesium transporter